MLKLQGITHSFDTLLFNNFNCEFKEGTSTAIVGKSGSGKSTLLHIASSLLKPQSGKVLYKGNDLYALSEDERLKIRRNEFGIIFQQHYLFKGFSAYENIELASILSKEKIDFDILKFLNIEHVLNKKTHLLSGGEQQRVSIARVLCKKPKLIFADEPSGNLDPKNAKNAIKLLCDYTKNNNSALFLITHDMELALMCDFRIEIG